MTAYLHPLPETPLSELELQTIAEAVNRGVFHADGKRIKALCRFRDWCRRQGRVPVWVSAGKVVIEGADVDQVGQIVGDSGKVKVSRGRIEVSKTADPAALAERLAMAMNAG